MASLLRDTMWGAPIVGIGVTGSLMTAGFVGSVEGGAAEEVKYALRDAGAACINVDADYRTVTLTGPALLEDRAMEALADREIARDVSYVYGSATCVATAEAVAAGEVFVPEGQIVVVERSSGLAVVYVARPGTDGADGTDGTDGTDGSGDGTGGTLIAIGAGVLDDDGALLDLGADVVDSSGDTLLDVDLDADGNDALLDAELLDCDLLETQLATSGGDVVVQSDVLEACGLLGLDLGTDLDLDSDFDLDLDLDLEDDGLGIDLGGLFD